LNIASLRIRSDATRSAWIVPVKVSGEFS
jgi:hypothetical protein